MPLEVCLLRNVSSIPGVVRLMDFYERPDSYILIMERPPNCKDLFDFITERGVLEEQLAQRFLKQIVDTVLACQVSWKFEAFAWNEIQNLFHRSCSNLSLWGLLGLIR